MRLDAHSDFNAVTFGLLPVLQVTTAPQGYTPPDTDTGFRQISSKVF